MSGVFSKDSNKKRGPGSFRRFKAGECLDDATLLQEKLNLLASSRTKCCEKSGNCLKNNFNLTKSFLPGILIFFNFYADLIFY